MRQKKAPIDYQLDYMERLFYKIKFKKTESYVIHRIWDKLDDTRIRFEIQQPIKLPNGKTVLADLYLPQLGIFIEVNEPYHESEQQKLADEYRNKAIIDITKDKLFVIQCGISDRAGEWRTLKEIHQQIDEVVSTNQRITFFRSEDALGIVLYRFLGVYQLDISKSEELGKCIWRRIRTDYKF